ncbi:hypothetical protein QBC46DRAFT_368322 [Diplogelasinospora grovesii]|uniref:GPI inositol-deacylase n=1 Tax=Diplogelasinospora grovesii TaxID=303347 RepID=A0AAN6MVK5_9PEZI|nr:hypothetical protein QBC46DRAFT_368322 [Diplogelasinospora grovesii]
MDATYSDNTRILCTKAAVIRVIAALVPTDRRGTWTCESLAVEHAEVIKGALGLNTLYDPPPTTGAVADIVFVHGLGGGSRKTWSYFPDPAHFWPREWLPTDPEFQGVRVHTFGYNSDWAERGQSKMDIHSFSQSLLGALKNEPSIRRDRTRIILVGHSMGGNVAKKAYILARQDPSCKDFAGRVHSMIFLGTPHHGSNLAATLDNVLSAAWGKKLYVKDLAPNSQILTHINDAFRHVAPDIHLWSFYETLPVRGSIMNRIVVEKDSATLGYPNERIAAMVADHRQVYPNYQSLRHLAAGYSLEAVGCRLRSFLSIKDRWVDVMEAHRLLKEPETCVWFIEKPFFKSWNSENTPILWLMGKPGSGKSIISCHVIEHSRPPHAYCSYFFFKRGALAYQMAMQDSWCETEGWSGVEGDEGYAWTKLFSNCIFHIGPSRHLWVIDGLDECANFNASFNRVFRRIRVFVTSRKLNAIVHGISGLGAHVHVHHLSDSDTLDDRRRYLTRRLNEIPTFEPGEDREPMRERILQESSGFFLWIRLVCEELEKAWTEDMREAALRKIPAGLRDFSSIMVQSIDMARNVSLAKCLLTWIVLATRPLTADELRCVVKLELNQKVMKAARAIPMICGQMVFVGEDEKAHMIHETARGFLLDERLSSQLAVHREKGHNRLASTLIRYLSSQFLKPQQAKLQSRHKLKIFAKPVAAPPRDMTPDTTLLDYAATMFSEHLSRCDSADDDLMKDVCTFLKTKVLSWIEYIAKSKDLTILTRTAMNLREYLARRTKSRPSIDPSARLVEGWATDLCRVAAKFGAQLLANPSSAHNIIPSLSPPDTIISGTSGTSNNDDFQSGLSTAVSHGNRLFAVGFSSGRILLYDSVSVQRMMGMTHPERVKSLHFGHDDQYLASAGAQHLLLWDPKSGAMLYSFHLQSPPLDLIFLGTEELLGIFQSSELTKWDLGTGERETISWKDVAIDDYDYPFLEDAIPCQMPIKATFTAVKNDILLAVAYRNHPVLIWNALELEYMGECTADANNGVDDMVFNPNPKFTALLVSYSDGRLCVFNYGTMTMIATLHNVYANRMEISSDGRFLLTAPCHGVIKMSKFDRDRDGNAMIVPIYGITSVDTPLRGLTFSSDGSRFLDLRGQQCRVWAPTVLLQKDDELESISNSLTSSLVKPDALSESARPQITTPLVVSADGRYVVAGDRGGGVALYSTDDGQKITTLNHHASGAKVVAVALGEAKKLVISADNHWHVLVAEVTSPLSDLADTTRSLANEPATAHVVLDREFGGAVKGLLVNMAANRLLVSSHPDVDGQSIDELWELPSGTVLGRATSPVTAVADPPPDVGGNAASGTASAPCSAFRHPCNPDWFVIVSGDIARVFAWDDYSKITGTDCIRLERTMSAPPLPSPPQQPIQSVLRSRRQPKGPYKQQSAASYHVGPGGLVVELLRSSSSHLLACAPGHLYAWPPRVFDPVSEIRTTEEANTILDAIGTNVLAMLGWTGTSTLVFLDANLWVCSIDLQADSSARIRFHFFALSEWRSADGELRCALVGPSTPVTPQAKTVTGTQDSIKVVFATGHHLVVVGCSGYGLEHPLESDDVRYL